MGNNLPFHCFANYAIDLRVYAIAKAGLVGDYEIHAFVSASAAFRVPQKRSCL